MTDTLGFVVLAKRPNPSRRSSTDHSCAYEPVKMRDRDTGVVFTGPNALEQAQNARDYCIEKLQPLDPSDFEVFELVPPKGDGVNLYPRLVRHQGHGCHDYTLRLADNVDVRLTEPQVLSLREQIDQDQNPISEEDAAELRTALADIRAKRGLS